MEKVGTAETFVRSCSWTQHNYVTRRVSFCATHGSKEKQRDVSCYNRCATVTRSHVSLPTHTLGRRKGIKRRSRVLMWLRCSCFAAFSANITFAVPCALLLAWYCYLANLHSKLDSECLSSQSAHSGVTVAMCDRSVCQMSPLFPMASIQVKKSTNWSMN